MGADGIEVVLKRFEAPDEVRTFPRGRFEVVRIGSLTVGRATYQPGWKWSTDVGPQVGAMRCSVGHTGLVLSGTATAAFDDGRIVELTEGSLFWIPPIPHDSWVVGERPYVSLHFMGAQEYAREAPPDSDEAARRGSASAGSHAVRMQVMTPTDWDDVAEVYGEGIAAGNATFEAQVPSWEQWDASHLAACRFVARDGGVLLGWAALSPVSRRPCYRGVAEVSVYVREAARGRGVGRALLEHLVEASEHAGIWTLQGSTFPENGASLRLQTACGFRVVGRRERIAQLHGRWRDTVLTERRSRRVGAQ